MRNRRTTPIQDAASKIGDLPMLPQALVRILSLRSDANDYFDQLEQLAKEEPAFAVRVLANANSADSSPIEPITSVRHGLTRMGIENVRKLVTALSVQRVFVPTDPNHVLLWQHSVCTAVGTQCVAQLLPQLNIDPDLAYIAGLLHDVGRFVMLEHAEESLNTVNLSHWSTPEELILADEEVFHYTHSDLGHMACRYWGLPEQLCEVVRTHHDTVAIPPFPGSVEAIVFCVQIADRLHLAVLNDIDKYNADYEQVICEKCLLTFEAAKLLDPQLLAQSVDDIYSESNQLLDALGFSLQR